MPAYNEAEVIGELLDRASDVLGALGLEWNVLVVDDGSADATAQIVRSKSEAESRIVLIQHEANKGLGPAILTALKAAVEISDAASSLVVSMDADLTHDPGLIPLMVESAEQGADVVIASRYQPGSEVIGLSVFRHLISWGARTVFRVLLPIPGVRDYTCGFRALRAHKIREALERFGYDGLIERKGFACTDELLIKLALVDSAIREVPFVLRYDLKEGASKINLPVTIRETFKLIAWARRAMREHRR